ncbi:MAG: hypothetical protein PWQ06_1737 [Anaerophaga sp.]|nr:hypothetical protein [Anaerophaga sp.]
MIAKGTKIWALLFFFVFSLFSSVVFAEGEEEDEPSESDKDKVDLLQVRDLGMRSFSISSTMASSTMTSRTKISRTNGIGYFTAYYNSEELTLEVTDYEGQVYVSIIGGYSINEVLAVDGFGVFDIDLGDLQPGTYNLEIEAQSVTYVGTLYIE